jgi:hypothetical protein
MARVEHLVGDTRLAGGHLAQKLAGGRHGAGGERALRLVAHAPHQAAEVVATAHEAASTSPTSMSSALLASVSCRRAEWGGAEGGQVHGRVALPVAHAEQPAAHQANRQLVGRFGRQQRGDHLERLGAALGAHPRGEAHGDQVAHQAGLGELVVALTHGHLAQDLTHVDDPADALHAAHHLDAVARRAGLHVRAQRGLVGEAQGRDRGPRDGGHPLGVGQDAPERRVVHQALLAHLASCRRRRRSRNRRAAARVGGRVLDVGVVHERARHLAARGREAVLEGLPVLAREEAVFEAHVDVVPGQARGDGDRAEVRCRVSTPKCSKAWPPTRRASALVPRVEARAVPPGALEHVGEAAIAAREDALEPLPSRRACAA